MKKNKYITFSECTIGGARLCHGRLGTRGIKTRATQKHKVFRHMSSGFKWLMFHEEMTKS